MTNNLMAGVSTVDITPPKGVELAGYPHFPRYNTGVHDPLSATCLYINDGESSIAIVGLDSIFLSKKHVSAVRAKVEPETGIKSANIMFCCSHSHSSPWAAGRLDMESMLAGIRQDESYTGELRDKLAGVVISASRTAFPCQIGFATEICGQEQGIGGNRRDPVNGPCDPNVYVLSVKDEEGVVRALLVSYAVHPTLLHEDNTLCSADYPGYLRACLREKFPHAVTVFCLGASGDQSPRYFRNGQTFNEAKRFGYTIGGAAIRAVDKTLYSKHMSIKSGSTVFNPKLRELPLKSEAERHVQEKRVIYDRLIAERAPYIDIQNANVALLGAEDILGYIIMREKGLPIELVEDEIPAEVSVLRIGDIYIAGLPGEVFIGISLLFRERSGLEKLIVSTVTNGCTPGYCYTREDGILGGYEVDTSMLDTQAGYGMVDALLSVLDDVKPGNA